MLKNETDELLLINFWSTWCRPYLIEYPEFIQIQRIYSERDFQFISCSLVSAVQEAKVPKFLKSRYSAVPIYLINTEDKYAVFHVFKNDWGGSLQNTLHIEPEGKASYKIP